jgi:hypothetical protein
MAAKIHVDIDVNDSKLQKAKKAFESLYKLSKQAEKQTNLGSSGMSPLGKPSKASSLLEKTMNDLARAYKKEKEIMDKQGKARYTWEKAKFVGGKVGRFAGAAAEGFHTGASLSSRMTSGHGEFTSGGFMNTIHDKISAAQDIYSKGKEGYSSIRDAYKGQEEKRDENGNVTQKARKGGIAAAAVAGLPVVGGVIGAVLGGVLNQINDMGKEYVSTIATQQGTFGATHGYVGGGGGHFANAQMAQAQVGFNRTQGKFGNDGAFTEKNAIEFASQQNIGIGQYAEQLGQLKENDSKISTDFLRGAADINRMTGLKQGQFVQKLAGYSNMLKESGFGKGGIGKFAALTGGLAKAGNLTGERAFGVGQAVDQGVRKGFEGGAISTLIVGEIAKAKKLSIPRAQAYLEEHGMQDESVLVAANKVSRRFMATDKSQEVGAELFASEGLMKRHEFYKMAEAQKKGGNLFTPSDIKDAGGISAGFNSQLSIDNARKSKIVEKDGVGQQAAALSHKAANDALELFSQLNKSGVLKNVVDALGKIETKTFEGINTSLEKISEYMDANDKGELFKRIGKDIREGMGF